MKLLSTIFFLSWLTSSARTDTLVHSYKNAVSYEVAGNALINGFNLNYHRFITLPSNEKITFGVRLGFGRSRYSFNPPRMQTYTPVDVSMLFGKKWLLPGVGFGYTPIWGPQEFRVHDPSSGNDVTLTRYFSDFWTFRCGLTVLPVRKKLPLGVFMRAEWTPALFHLHNNPYHSGSFLFLYAWGGLTLGITF